MRVRLELGYIINKVVHKALDSVNFHADLVFQTALMAFHLVLSLFVQRADQSFEMVLLTANLLLKL